MNITSVAQYFMYSALAASSRKKLKPPKCTRRIASLLSAQAIAPPLGLTCAGKTDGAGAQILAMMSTISFCRAFSIPYIHTPLHKVEHVGSQAEIEQWEALFALGTNEPKAAPPLPEPVDIAEFVATPRLWSEPRLLRCEHMHQSTDTNPASYLRVQPELRRKYTGMSPRQGSALKVAVHVRRGDVSHATHSDRYTPTSRISALVAQLTETAAKLNVETDISIFSQGSDAEFHELRSRLGCKLCFDRDPIETMQELIAADVLVTAKSAFSYVAALLSSGVVVYEPFWHSPLPGWIAIPSSGTLPQHDLSQRIARHRSRR